MNHKITIQLWLPLLFLVPNLFSEVRPTSPRLAEPLSAVELVTNTSLVPANEEAAAQFDENFSKPIQINDGRKRSYVLAVDELYQPTPDGVGQIIPIKESSKPSTLASVANILAKEKKQETRLILYPVGAPHNDQTRRILSRDVVVKTDNKTAALSLATDAGMRLKYEADLSPSHLIFTSDSAAQSFEFSQNFKKSGFPDTEPAVVKLSSKRFFPNDPLFPNQWHIRGRGQNGAKKASDAKITPVWDQRDSSGNLIRGTGIVIGITDDGVEMDHPDLSANIRTDLSYNFHDQTSDPSPGATDFHGTAVAGVAAAVGFNGLGVTGAAPGSQIAALKQGFTDADEAASQLWQSGLIRVNNNSWGPSDNGQTIDAPGSAMASALRSTAESGTITIWSAGNGLSASPSQLGKDNANYDGYANSIYVLSVGAVNDQAVQCDYSESGANVIISAPAGNDGVRPQGTTTTDITGPNGYNSEEPLSSLKDFSSNDYTNGFNGTSSAAPVVSGVTALLLQSNPTLNWRDVKEIYIRSATKNDPSDSDWARNGAGFWFNHKYGAGLINASDAVRLAKNWSNLATMTSISVPLSSLPATIRDNNASGLVKYFDTRSLSGLRVEHATLMVDIPDLPAGEQVIELTSPAGTKNVLSEVHNDTTNDYSPWTFSTVHNWGEDSRGLWKLKIADRVSGNTGTLNSATLTLYGTANNN